MALLSNWVTHGEEYWYPMPDASGLGCYGSGYNAWGVQTNQKYLAAMAALSELGDKVSGVPPLERNRARQRALTALRFSLRSHVTGDYRCTDGTQWGHTWISALGLERMMYGVYLLDEHLTDEDHALLRGVLTSEARWLATDHKRGGHRGIHADRWAHTGKNAPESNLWNGALLWRTAEMYSDEADADAWREQAHRFLLNAVSVPADAQDERLFEGKPIREWHIGANFFPNYALDHHGYLNVGYMVICLSNAAMLHFDMQTLGLAAPASLYHHLGDLWQVLRRFIFADGRLARIGGDTRIRYAYCQDYLLPVLLFAAVYFGDGHALHLFAQQCALLQQEADYAGDGSFFGKRLADLAESNPYYYTRLESDRACVLGMAAAYVVQLQGYLGAPERASQVAQDEAAAARADAFEQSVAGDWCEPEHGAMVHRSATRLASFAWRAYGLAQGMCLPPDDGHLAEWPQNLGGYVRFVGDESACAGTRADHRRLSGCRVEPFDGGFVTCGAVLEGVDVRLAEGWHAPESALHQIAFAALPDNHTVIGLEQCRTGRRRTYLAEVKGLHLNLPNDLYNGFSRTIATGGGEILLETPVEEDCLVSLHSKWALIEGRLGVVGLYGAQELTVHRFAAPHGGPYASLCVDEVCFHCALGTRAVDAGKTILDVGWAVLAGVDAGAVQRFGERQMPLPVTPRIPVRGVRVQGLDGRTYVVLANFDSKPQEYGVIGLLSGARTARDLAGGETVTSIATGVSLEPAQARVFVVER